MSLDGIDSSLWWSKLVTSGFCVLSASQTLCIAAACSVNKHCAAIKFSHLAFPSAMLQLLSGCLELHEYHYFIGCEKQRVVRRSYHHYFSHPQSQYPLLFTPTQANPLIHHTISYCSQALLGYKELGGTPQCIPYCFQNFNLVYIKVL